MFWQMSCFVRLVSHWRSFALVSVFFGAPVTQAMTLDWSGGYRAEFMSLESTSLSNPKEAKSYILNQLWLSPRIVASDGVNIVSRLEVLPNREERYRHSQLGQFWGLGSLDGGGSFDNSQMEGRRQISSELLVSQLYLQWDQEFGQLIVGRAPVHFGLGMTHNAGLDAFDHWYDTRDYIGYKFVIGNLFIMPMWSQVYKRDTREGRAVTDQILHLEYDNVETGSAIGIFYEQRNGPQNLNDVPFGYAGGSGTVSGRYAVRNLNLFLSRKWDSFDFQVESGFREGGLGISNDDGDSVDVNSFGLALETNYRAPGSAFTWSLWAGSASGNDPSTSSYEGYFFHRNYDVAFLMMNHPLGGRDSAGNTVDIFGSQFQRIAPDGGTVFDNNANAVDEEVVSNVLYLSPRLSYQYSDYLQINNILTYAQLNTDTLNTNMGRDLGLEWDIEFLYQPRDRVLWSTKVGLLFPGSAFQAGDLNLDNNFTYGITTRAAITF